MSNKTPQCSGSACYPNRCPNGQCSLHPAEACTDIGAEPRGKHRNGPFARFALWLRRVLG